VCVCARACVCVCVCVSECARARVKVAMASEEEKFRVPVLCNSNTHVLCSMLTAVSFLKWAPERKVIQI
jgi:hypothetical protein